MLLLFVFISSILPKPAYQRSNSHFFLRWTAKFSSAAFVALIIAISLEPNLLQTPRGQISIAGFDFACESSRLSYEESMAEQNLIVTAIIAGAFLLVQVVIFVICLSRISQVKREEAKPN